MSVRQENEVHEEANVETCGESILVSEDVDKPSMSPSSKSSSSSIKETVSELSKPKSILRVSTIVPPPPKVVPDAEQVESQVSDGLEKQGSGSSRAGPGKGPKSTVVSGAQNIPASPSDDFDP